MITTTNTYKPTTVVKRGRGRPKGKKTESHPQVKRPKRPLSAYNLFFKDERAKMKNARISFSLLGKLIGSRWKEIDNKQKSKYEQHAAKLMKIHKLQMKEYNAKVNALDEAANASQDSHLPEAIMSSNMVTDNNESSAEDGDTVTTSEEDGDTDTTSEEDDDTTNKVSFDEGDEDEDHSNSFYQTSSFGDFEHVSSNSTKYAGCHSEALASSNNLTSSNYQEQEIAENQQKQYRQLPYQDVGRIAYSNIYDSASVSTRCSVSHHYNHNLANRFAIDPEPLWSSNKYNYNTTLSQNNGNSKQPTTLSLMLDDAIALLPSTMMPSKSNKDLIQEGSVVSNDDSSLSNHEIEEIDDISFFGNDRSDNVMNACLSPSKWDDIRIENIGDFKLDHDIIDLFK